MFLRLFWDNVRKLIFTNMNWYSRKETINNILYKELYDTKSHTRLTVIYMCLPFDAFEYLSLKVLAFNNFISFSKNTTDHQINHHSCQLFLFFVLTQQNDFKSLYLWIRDTNILIYKLKRKGKKSDSVLCQNILTSQHKLIWKQNYNTKSQYTTSTQSVCGCNFVVLLHYPFWFQLLWIFSGHHFQFFKLHCLAEDHWWGFLECAYCPYFKKNPI